MHIVKTLDVQTPYRLQVQCVSCWNDCLSIAQEGHKEERYRSRDLHNPSYDLSYLGPLDVTIEKVFRMTNWWLSSSPDETFVRWFYSTLL